MTISDAMREAVDALGPVTIDKERAAEQLGQLAVALDDLTRRAAAYAKKAEDAKIAKQSFESAKDILVELVRTFTHAEPMPLFDKAQAEDDHQAMLGAASDDDKQPGDSAPF